MMYSRFGSAQRLVVPFLQAMAAKGVSAGAVNSLSCSLRNLTKPLWCQRRFLSEGKVMKTISRAVVVGFMVALAGLMAACGGTIEKHISIDANAKEEIKMPGVFDVKVTGETVYQKEKEVIKVGEIFKENMIERLKKHSLYRKDAEHIENKYVIVADIESYAPGSALKRYFTEHSIDAESYISANIYLCKLDVTAEGEMIGKRLAAFPVAHSIFSKGLVGFIGGWKTVIEHAGIEAVDTIVNIFVKQ